MCSILCDCPDNEQFKFFKVNLFCKVTEHSLKYSLGEVIKDGF